ncbi:MAG TPA: hypothetical protein VKA67_13270, partial [Verrucomicrobiae bacterium]|nr:hypothetical protein [Verrucomicrobiae bacterium]
MANSNPRPLMICRAGALIALRIVPAAVLVFSPWLANAGPELKRQEAAAVLDSYNVVWHSQSENSAESMPVGGG